MAKDPVCGMDIDEKKRPRLRLITARLITSALKSASALSRKTLPNI